MTRRDLRNEAEHLPDGLDDLIELHERVVELGESRQIADGLCMWLLGKAQGQTDTTASNTRARYRKILARLDRLDPVGPVGAKIRARGDRGGGDLRTLAAGGAMATIFTLAASGHVGAAIAGAPIILVPDVMSAA